MCGPPDADRKDFLIFVKDGLTATASAAQAVHMNECPPVRRHTRRGVHREVDITVSSDATGVVPTVQRTESAHQNHGIPPNSSLGRSKQRIYCLTNHAPDGSGEMDVNIP